MSNPNNMNNTTNNILDFSTMSKDELENGRNEAASNKDWKLVGEYTNAIDNFKEEVALDTLDITNKKVTKKMIYEAALRDIAAHKTQLNQKDQTVTSKDAEIADLMKQLDEEKNDKNKLLTNPSLKGYFSLSRVRISKILNKMTTLRADTTNYPKNVIIYAMGIMSSKYFSIGQGAKRLLKKFKWSSRIEDMKSNIESLIKLCSAGGDSTMKEAIKKGIRTEVVAANTAYISKIQNQKIF